MLMDYWLCSNVPIWKDEVWVFGPSAEDIILPIVDVSDFSIILCCFLIPPNNADVFKSSLEKSG